MVTEERRLPFAVAGDEVILEPGVYREWVNPINGCGVFSVIEDNPADCVSIGRRTVIKKAGFFDENSKYLQIKYEINTFFGIYYKK